MIAKEEGLKKLQRYCIYQERCHSEVRTKLLNLKIYGELLEEIISDLIKDDFLNEQRFAESYAGGKFRIKKWGKQKIIQKLKSKYVSDYCINKGLAVIGDEEYKKTLLSIINKYMDQKKIKSITSYDRHHGCIKYCQNKGYDYALIKDIIGTSG